jgi:hypothetical protein
MKDRPLNIQPARISRWKKIAAIPPIERQQPIRNINNTMELVCPPSTRITTAKKDRSGIATAKQYIAASRRRVIRVAVVS